MQGETDPRREDDSEPTLPRDRPRAAAKPVGDRAPAEALSDEHGSSFRAIPVLPDHVGPFKVGDVIGQGGFGVVFRAWDTRLERPVVLKTSSLSVRDAGELRRVEREARALAVLNHPNVASIHALEWVDDRPVIVMEMIEGVTLRDAMGHGPLPLHEALDACAQVAAGLAAAHAAGLVHRDLKPPNVMRRPDGLVKILDFGLACIHEAVSTSRAVGVAEVTDPRVIIGTPPYMSPEQARGETLDARSDAWSFGCVLYECLTGVPAFDLMRGARRSDEPDWSRLPSELSDDARDLLRECLRPDPRERLGRLDEAAAVLRGRGLTSRPVVRRTALPHGLPSSLTSLVGREQEAAALREALAEYRLITLVGSGGCGKTRLAIDVAESTHESRRDGTRLVELATLRDSDAVATAVAAAVGARDAGDRTVAEQLVDFLRDREFLLILDNCEHVIDGCRALSSDLLAHCPGVQVLATSREALGVNGERTLPLGPLPIPDTQHAVDPQALSELPSVTLFLDRARAVRPDFDLTQDNAAAVAEICRRVDGIPLALELAAARLRVLSPRQLARRLDDCFRVLSGGKARSVPHHAAIRATLDWSHDLLEETERALYRRLAIFRGGWTLEAAESVAAGGDVDEIDMLDLLERLADKSLVVVEQVEDEPRFRLLELVREHAREKLDASEDRVDVAARHAAHHVRIAEEAEEALRGPDQAACLRALVRESGNLGAAFDALLGEARDVEGALRLATALRPAADLLGRLGQGRRDLERALEAAEGADISDGLLARALNAAAALARRSGATGAQPLYERALEMFRQAEDVRGVGIALHNLGEIAASQGRPERARSLYGEALDCFRECDDRHATAGCLYNLALLEAACGEPARAMTRLEESLALNRATGNEIEIARCIGQLGALAREAGDLAKAQRHLEESLRLHRDLGAKGGLAAQLHNLALVAQARGDVGAARAAFEEELELSRDTGSRTTEAHALHGLAHLALQEERLADASSLLSRCLDVYDDVAAPDDLAHALATLADLATAGGRPEQAARLLGAGHAVRERAGRKLADTDREEVERRVARVRGLVQDEERFAAAWNDGAGSDFARAVQLGRDATGIAP